MELRIIDTADFNPIFERITKDFPRNERPGRGPSAGGFTRENGNVWASLKRKR